MKFRMVKHHKQKQEPNKIISAKTHSCSLEWNDISTSNIKYRLKKAN